MLLNQLLLSPTSSRCSARGLFTIAVSSFRRDHRLVLRTDWLVDLIVEPRLFPTDLPRDLPRVLAIVWLTCEDPPLPAGLRPACLRMTFALKRFAMLSMYGGITTRNSNEISD